MPLASTLMPGKPEPGGLSRLKLCSIATAALVPVSWDVHTMDQSTALSLKMCSMSVQTVFCPSLCQKAAMSTNPTGPKTVNNPLLKALGDYEIRSLFLPASSISPCCWLVKNSCLLRARKGLCSAPQMHVAVGQAQ